MTYRIDTKLVIERSVRNFISVVNDLTNNGYYPSNGGLVVNKKIESIFPLRIIDEYVILLQKTIKLEEREGL